MSFLPYCVSAYLGLQCCYAAAVVVRVPSLPETLAPGVSTVSVTSGLFTEDGGDGLATFQLQFSVSSHSGGNVVTSTGGGTWGVDDENLSGLETLRFHDLQVVNFNANGSTTTMSAAGVSNLGFHAVDHDAANGIADAGRLFDGLGASAAEVSWLDYNSSVQFLGHNTSNGEADLTASILGGVGVAPVELYVGSNDSDTMSANSWRITAIDVTASTNIIPEPSTWIVSIATVLLSLRRKR